MTDQVRMLLLGRGYAGGEHASDVVSDSVMSLFGVTGEDAGRDEDTVDRLMPLAMAPDLSRFRRFYDRRVTPSRASSIYRQTVDSLSESGLYERVLGYEGWWSVNGLFQHDDPAIYSTLSEMRSAALSKDAPYALGAVLLAVAYRRWVAHGGD